MRWQLNAPATSSIALERSDALTGPWLQLTLELQEIDDLMVAQDLTVRPGRTYWYRLVVDGLSYQPIAITAGEVIETFNLAIAPNPTTGPTTIEYTVPAAGMITIQVLDVAGRVVAEVERGVRRPGRYQVPWAGDLEGRAARPGVYFVRLQTPEGSVVRRLVVSL